MRDILSALAASRSEAARSRAGKKSLKGVPIPKSEFAGLDALTVADSGFQLDVDTRAHRQRIDAAFERRYPVPRRLGAELRPYQQEGFRWLARLAELSLSACLADDMGLGKTVQLVALLLHRTKTGPALVVAPTSVCDNWRDELLRFASSLRVRWYLGAGQEAELEGLAAGQVVITTYSLLPQDIERLQSIEFGTAVLDEAQFIKNSESQRARAAYLLKRRVSAHPWKITSVTCSAYFSSCCPICWGTRHVQQALQARRRGRSGRSGERKPCVEFCRRSSCGAPRLRC